MKKCVKNFVVFFSLIVVSFKIMKRYFLDFFVITIGAVISAFALEGFLIPNSIIDGGIVGISIMSSYLTKINLGWFTFFFNLPFLILAYQKFGKMFVLK